jgi:hypothetical protein
MGKSSLIAMQIRKAQVLGLRERNRDSVALQAQLSL